MKALLIGNASGRLSCTAQAIRESKRGEDNPMHFVEILTNYRNPQLEAAGYVNIGNITDPDHITRWLLQLDSTNLKNDIAIISDEAPLAAGMADLFLARGIPTFGPIKRMTIEASKITTRKLMESCGLDNHNPVWRAFGGDGPRSTEHIEAWIDDLGACVIKPDGLTGGKGVWVQGEHFQTTKEGVGYCREIMKEGGSLIIEAKHVGEEFSLQTLSDGTITVDLPPVFDCKRLEPGDTGPNTGGMGSWCCTTELPSWLTPELLAKASEINRTVIETLQSRMTAPYRGVLYGNFMVCREGLILIEFNCRFGDPEIMNLVPLLETSFSDIIAATATGTLTADMVRFRQGASVVKYLVPLGYPSNPAVACAVDTQNVRYEPNLHIYKASLIRHVIGERTTWHTTGSRAVAVAGVGDSLFEAEKIVERGISQIDYVGAPGRLFHRHDIATQEFFDRRHARMEQIMAGDA